MTVPMEADSEISAGPSSSSSSSSSSSKPQVAKSSRDAQEGAGHYQFYLGDSEGLLKSHRIARVGEEWTSEGVPSVIRVQGLKGNGTVANESCAVQKMASGVVNGLGYVVSVVMMIMVRRWMWLTQRFSFTLPPHQLAIARKNATIDIVIPSSASPAKLVTTIDNSSKMKAGLQRWVGLAVAPHGVYACTSAGDWTLSSITTEADEAVVQVTPRLALPEPLQSCSFHPSYDPKWFAYGGEEVPLSCWGIEQVISGRSQEAHHQADGEDDESQTTEYTAPNGDEVDTTVPTLNSKQRKRKRQVEARAKAKELLPGELWRAKNLPNDALSLPQRPNVTSIAFLQDAADADRTRSSSLPFQIATGTRDGLIRIYDPSSGVRKHLEEFRVVPHTSAQGQVTSPIKGLYPTQSPSSSLVAADGSGRLACVDWTQAKSRYQWKDISGSITSVVSFTSAHNSGTQLILSASHDRMIRLHSLTSDKDVPNTKGQHGDRGKNLLSTFSGGAGVTAMAWDGIVPVEGEGDADADADESMRSHKGPDDDDGDHEDGDEDEDDEDGVWDAMQEVGSDGHNNHNSSSRRSTGAKSTTRQTRRQRAIQAEETEAADEEEVKEERSKRKK